MRANIYLGEVVTKLIDAPYSEYSEKREAGIVDYTLDNLSINAES